MQVQPFRAWYADPARAAKIAAVPYDVVDTPEARALAAGNPVSYLRVSRPEIDLPDRTDPHSDAVHRQGLATLRQFQRDGTLRREAAPVFYLYRLRMGAHTQTGLVACFATEDYENRVIKTHEKTRRDKEDDRTRHIDLMNAHTEPVFLVYRDQAAVTALLAPVTAAPPVCDFTAPDGISHTLWRIADTAPLVDAFRKVPACYIADGHHRAAASARLARDRRASNSRHTGAEPYNWFLAVLFPASQVQILPYNRTVKDLNGRSAAEFLAAVRARFAVRENVPPPPAGTGRACFYLAGRWHELTLQPGATAETTTFDVTVLQEQLLQPVLGIDDPRTSPRLEFVGGIRGTDELARRVDSGRAAVAFAMYPVTVQQMMTIADAGGILPPKSTWFEPKLRSGLFVHDLD
jgi:uncharacterized protein (DUF1015 family)